MSELDDLADEAWTASPARAKELWKRAKKHPDMERSGWTYEWVRKKGYESDHRQDQNQLEWAAIGLAIHGDPRVVPFILARAAERWDFGRMLLPWLETDRIDRARLAAAVRPWLSSDETGVHEWKLAARCLARAGAREDAELVAPRLGICFDAMWSPDASQTVRMEQHAASLGASLLRIGVPRSFVPMLEAVVSVESHSIDRARGTAAQLLASSGVGLDPIARGLKWELDHGHASRVVPGQVLAIGALGRDAPEEARRGLAALVRRAAGDGDEAREMSVAIAAALTDLGMEADLTAAARACLAQDRYGWSDVVHQLVFVLDLVGSRTDLPADLAAPFVREDDSRLHRAAFRALKTRGAKVPETRIADVCTLHHLPASALRDAVGDERWVPRIAVAKELVARPNAEAAPALASTFDALPRERHRDDPRRGTRRHWLRALVATGSAEGHAVVARALAEDPKLVDVAELPAALAKTVATIFLETKDKHLRDDAKHWIAQRTTAPEVVRALEPLGLAPEDFPLRPQGRIR